MWHYKWRFIITDIIRILSSAAVALQPYFMGKFAASLNDKEAAFNNLVYFFIAGVIHGVLWNGNDFIVANKIIPLYHEYKKIAFKEFWTEPYTTFIEKPSGKVGYYVNQLPAQLYGLYDAYHYGFLSIATAIPIYGILLLSLAWQSTVIYMVFLTVTLVMLAFIARILATRQRAYTDVDSSNSGRVFDSYANFVNVFSFKAQQKEIIRNDTDLDKVIAYSKKAEYTVMSYWSSASFMARVVLWSAIIFFSWHMYDTGQIDFAALVISIAVLVDFTNIFWNVVHRLGAWKKVTSAYRESYDYLFGSRNMVKDFYARADKSLLSRPDFTSTMSIQDLSFAYPDAPDNDVLKNINLDISKNEKIGIVGKSGSGKSTLVKILLGFYDIDNSPTAQGSITIDGQWIHNTELSQYYAYVPQDTTLFQESIYYNIAYAKEGRTTLQEVKAAANKAHIDEFIESLPRGYETKVGERGVKLSLGQRQRIAIARAFLKEAPLLILDEATSSLDSKTESYVQESFEKLWGNKSVIAIAHRLSTLNNVDRIVVMSKGEIVEQGTKEELLALEGHFADLWTHQRKGMI